MARYIFQRTFFALFALITVFSFISYSQQAKKPLCDEQRFLLLAEKQVDEIAVSVEPQKQIAVMIRAADVLWTRQQASARKMLADAFDRAEKLFKEKGDETRNDGRLQISLPDQRFVVMRAIAKRDAAWAKKLATRISDESRHEAEEKVATLKNEAAANSSGSVPVQDKLLGLASSLVAIDEPTAIALARSAFTYPLGSSLGHFCYALADVNKATADLFYREALQRYASAPLAGFLQLSAYPFAYARILGAEAFMTGFRLPQDPQPNPALQQLFIEALLRRAEMNLKTPQEQPSSGAYQLPESSQLFIAFTQLEPIALQHQPALVNRIIELKSYLNASFTNEIRQQTETLLNQQKAFSGGGNNFERFSEMAEREANPTRREMHYARAITTASADVNLDTLVSMARKIDDEKVRDQLINLIYFKHSQKAIKDGQFFEAMQLAKNVGQLDLRAYLAYEMAAAALKKEEEKPRVREILEEVVEFADKSPNTNEKARTLLGVVHLYAKIDQHRAFVIMSEAVKTINYLTDPDFTTTFINQKIEGKSFSSYSSYQVEGFNLETVFRLLAPLDMESALWRAQSLDDKSLRAYAVLSLASFCLDSLNHANKQSDAEKKKAGKPTPTTAESGEKKTPPAKKQP